MFVTGLPTISYGARSASFQVFSAVADQVNMLRVGYTDWVNSATAPPNAVTTPTSGFRQNPASVANYVYDWYPERAGSRTVAVAAAPSMTVDATLLSAPDGTTTAQKVIEASDTSKTHYLTAGFGSTFGTTNNYYQMRYRLAVFAKAAERTRIAIQIGEARGRDLQSNGIRCVYDLAGGQIGVAPYRIGGVAADEITGWIAGDASITDFGDGWYRCVLDATCPRIDFDLAGATALVNNIKCRFFTDSGSGTAAESTTYNGDGTSGVLVWKSNLLTPAAWELTERIYFNGFDDPSTSFDYDNTLVNGYGAYNCPYTPALQSTSSGAEEWMTAWFEPEVIVIEDSILEQTPRNTYPSTEYTRDVYGKIGTAAWVGPENGTDNLDGEYDPDHWVGSLFTLPMMVNVKMAHDQFFKPNAASMNVGVSDSTIWTHPAEYLSVGLASPGVGLGEIHFVEMDFLEWGPNAATHWYLGDRSLVQHQQYSRLIWPGEFAALRTGTVSISTSSDILTSSDPDGLNHDQFPIGGYIIIYYGTPTTTDQYEVYEVVGRTAGLDNTCQIATNGGFTNASASFAKMDNGGAKYEFSDMHEYYTIWLPKTGTDEAVVLSFFDGMLVHQFHAADGESDPTTFVQRNLTDSDDMHHLLWFGGETSRWDHIAVWGEPGSALPNNYGAS